MKLFGGNRIVGSFVPTFAIVVAAQFAAADPPRSVSLSGVIRDFRNGHPDFYVGSAQAIGQVAGMVAQNLGAQQRAVFTSRGVEVLEPFHDRFSQPMAPHLFYDKGVVCLHNAPVINNDAIVDTWDSAAGPYGGNNVGPAPHFEMRVSMPTIQPPSDLPFIASDVLYQGVGTWTLTTSFQCNNLVINSHATVYVSGDVTIHATQLARIENQAKLRLLPGATFNLFAANLIIQNVSEVNLNTFQPNRCNLFGLGNKAVLIENHSGVCANLITPNAPLHVAHSSHFYGTMLGLSAIVEHASGLHVDGVPLVLCGLQVIDTAGELGAYSNAGVHSPKSFAHWFHDVPGINLSQPHTIELVRNSSGVYEFIDESFHPIDGQLFGNQGADHNWNFTYALTGEFIHHACEAGFFEFRGADDAWLFVDGKLAIDLGGMTGVCPPQATQRIDLDRLGLEDSRSYGFHLFYAQRQDRCAMFELRTNADLVP